MNTSRPIIESYAGQTFQALSRLSGSGNSSPLVRETAGQRLVEVRDFTDRLSRTPGDNVDELLQTSQARGGGPMRKAVTLGGAVLGAVAAVSAATLAFVSLPAVAAVAVVAVGSAAAATCFLDVRRNLAEERFRGQVLAFARDAESGVPPGLMSGWQPGGQASRSDDDWLINPANPASPLSPLNPGNPASPLNPGGPFHF